MSKTGKTMSTLACMGSLAMWHPAAHAASAALPDITIKAVLDGAGVQTHDANGTADTVVAETIRFKDGAVRLDFDGGARLRGSIYKEGERMWLQAAGSAHAIPMARLPLASVTQLDPAKPCADLGFYCEHTNDRLIVGRRATGWRYDHAGHAGPVGTDSGVLWIDAEYGVLLALAAQDTRHRDYKLETVSVTFDSIPPAVFVRP